MKPGVGGRFEDLGFARVDHDRVRRRGYPEAIFASGKTVEQVISIGESLVGRGARNVLVTRATDETIRALAERFSGVLVAPEARLCVLNPVALPPTGHVVVVAWRLEDVPVAEEAAWTAEMMGSAVTRRFDAPFRAPDRFPEWFASLDPPRAMVVAEGGGGSLASVVAGLARCIVVAVPTSAGSALGSPWEGVPPLLAHLNSCVPGVVVVNIDNGFGGGYAAHLVNVGAVVAEEEPYGEMANVSWKG